MVTNPKPLPPEESAPPAESREFIQGRIAERERFARIAVAHPGTVEAMLKAYAQVKGGSPSPQPEAARPRGDLATHVARCDEEQCPICTPGQPEAEAPPVPTQRRCPVHSTVDGTNTITNWQCLYSDGHEGEHKYDVAFLALKEELPRPPAAASPLPPHKFKRGSGWGCIYNNAKPDAYVPDLCLLRDDHPIHVEGEEPPRGAATSEEVGAIVTWMDTACPHPDGGDSKNECAFCLIDFRRAAESAARAEAYEDAARLADHLTLKDGNLSRILRDRARGSERA